MTYILFFWWASFKSYYFYVTYFRGEDPQMTLLVWGLVFVSIIF